MTIVNALGSALVNLILLVGLPLLVYSLYTKRRHHFQTAEIVRRTGLQLGECRYIGYSLILAVILVATLIIWSPSVEPFTRKGSPQQNFVGLGLTAKSVAMALIYGVMTTGFSEEFLFRGLIAGSLSRKLPLVWANVIQAAIFLIPHIFILFVMPEMWALIPLVFLFALFAGWLRIKSGSIVGPWLIHASLNVTMCLSVAIRTAT